MAGTYAVFLNSLFGQSVIEYVVGMLPLCIGTISMILVAAILSAQDVHDVRLHRALHPAHPTPHDRINSPFTKRAA
jgi:hypothetical protein